MGGGRTTSDPPWGRTDDFGSAMGADGRVGVAVRRCLDGLPAEDFAYGSLVQKRPGFFGTEDVPSRSVPAYRTCFAERAATLRFAPFTPSRWAGANRIGSEFQSAEFAVRKRCCGKLRTTAVYPKWAGYFKSKMAFFAM
jgi:hypothetical protein